MLHEMLEAVPNFAAILGLIYNFQQGRDAKTAASSQEFFEFLASHQYQGLITNIKGNQVLLTELDNLLRQGHTAVMNKLNQITEILVSLASRVGGLQSFAMSFSPNSGLSDQAVDILRHFVRSNATFVIEVPQGMDTALVPDQGEPIPITEQRFVQDDLDRIYETGLLTLTYCSDGNRRFHITRAAEQFVKLMES